MNGFIQYISDGTAALQYDYECEQYASHLTIELQMPEMKEDVYVISTVEELYWFAGLVNDDPAVCDYDEETNPSGIRQNTRANAILKNDITVNEDLMRKIDENGAVKDGEKVMSWTPIGKRGHSFTQVFEGTFDGAGHTVSGLYVYDEECSHVGLFGYNNSRGVIQNVGVTDSYFHGKNDVGGVCGQNNGTIRSCYNTGKVVGRSNVGGVCGLFWGKLIQNCYNTGMVVGERYVGEVCGDILGGTLQNCYYISTVCGDRYPVHSL